MAVKYQTTNSFGPTISPFVSAGDTFVLPQNITIAADNDALSTNIEGFLNIDGNVTAVRSAISLSSNGTSVVNIGPTAHLSGGSLGAGLASITVLAYGTHYISNAGTITNTNSVGAGWAIDTVGAGAILNSGLITSDHIAVGHQGSNVTDVVRLFNTGVIVGADFSYNSTNAVDEITNSGTMTGHIITSSGDDKIINYGHIFGNIDLGDNNDALYTDISQLGPYTIQGGTGTDTLVNLDSGHTASLNMATTGFETYYSGAMASYVYGGTATVALTFVGAGGADAFIGGAGADVAIGGAGGDYLDGGAGSNTLSYSTSLQGVTVNLAAGTASGGDAAGDMFLNFQNVSGSAANDVLIGDGGANSLVGDAGNDFMFGGNGADFFIGGAGIDYMSGGAGNDIFYYAGPGYGNDEITDFTIGQDTMYISTSIAANFAGLTIFQYLTDTYIGAGGSYFHLDNTVATNINASSFVFF